MDPTLPDMDVFTSFRSLLEHDEGDKRVVRIPKPEALAGKTAMVLDPRYNRDVPAVIGITGRFEGVGTVDGKPVGQWNVAVWPDHERVNLKMADEEQQEVIRSLHRELMKLRPMVGTTYECYFAVPPDGAGSGENAFTCTFNSATERRREHEAFVRRSRDPRVAVRHLLGRDVIADPWLEDVETYDRVDGLLRAKLIPVMQRLWGSWTKDPGVAMLLRGQGVPVDVYRKTQYRPGNVRQEIRKKLRPTAQRTVFVGKLRGLDDVESGGAPSVERFPIVPISIVCVGLVAAVLAFLIAHS